MRGLFFTRQNWRLVASRGHDARAGYFVPA